MDKLSEWITQTIEQGNLRPIEVKSLDHTTPKRGGTQDPQGRTSHPSAQKPKASFSPNAQSKGKPFTGNNFQNNNRTNNNNSFNKQKSMNKTQEQPKQAQKQQLGTRPTQRLTQRPQGQQPRPQSQRPQSQRPQSQRPAQRPQGPQSRPQQPQQKPKLKKPPELKQEKTTIKAFKGLRIIPLGGLDEVGKNMTAYEYNRTGREQDKEIVVVDMGLQFPEDDMLGVDYVIPDATYLEENKSKIKAVIITHGHLDHIGGLPYILPKLNYPPVYSTRLTNELIVRRLEEFQLEKLARLHLIDPKHSIKVGSFNIEFFRVAHSIPDSVGVVVGTPEGKVVYTGDFKFDDAPAGIQEKADIEKMKSLGQQNILALLSDSTNATKPGHTMSEAEIGPNIEKFIANAKGRVMIASFSSLIGRIQQIFEYAQRYNRKIYISGRSVKESIDIGLKLGLIKVHTNMIHDIKNVKNAKDSEVLIMTTGAQGESLSSLARIARGDHPNVRIKPNDTVIISSTPIIGNERAIFTVINNLCMLGANVIHSQISQIHTSGHAYQDELVQMMGFIKPKYFVPVHGEFFMRQAHKELAIKNGIAEQNCMLLRNGAILEITNGQAEISHESVEAKYILIDGLGEGEMSSRVISERQILSQNGVLAVIVTIDKKTKKLRETPSVLSRGFMYVHEYEEITAEIAQIVGDNYRKFISKTKNPDRKEIKNYIRAVAERYTHQKLERRPLVLPLVFEC